MKRIAICCDGTWNRPDQVAGGKARPTNVTKMALAIASEGTDGARQQVYYHRGVGTSRFDHIRGGVFGWGLSANIRDAYLYLVRNYQPGDEIFLFGFSRGAYTARSLAGLIRNSGLLRPEHEERLDDAYALYRQRGDDSRPTSTEAELFRRSYTFESLGLAVRIKFIGVWDTVGSLGIPIGVLGTLSRTVLHLQFHDVDLSSFVDNAFHALAIDERRSPFEPSIWRQQSHAKNQRLEQVWFAGVHSNVGGGYEDTGLSDIALQWLCDRAHECDLDFRTDYLDSVLRKSVRGRLVNSRTGVYLLMKEHVRPIHATGMTPSFEKVHPSVHERMVQIPSYQPVNLQEAGAQAEVAGT